MMRRWLARRRLARHLKRVHRDLGTLELAMQVNHLSRHERRRIWREVISGRLSPHELIG